jgi:PAS domain S-box-containing protein
VPDKILIVEDERITAEDLADILSGLGYEVSGVVSSGAEAIRLAETSPPDLVLMDIRIKGDMDGAETARILRERFDIPAVYLTAHADRETLERAKQARPIGYIVKPFHESELHASVEIALYKHRHDRRAVIRQQHITDVLSSLILGIISVDEAETVLLVNPAAEGLTGWSNQEASGSPARQVFRLADLDTGKQVEVPLGQALHQRTLAEIQDRLLVTKRGDQKLISGNIAPIPGFNGGTRGAVIMFESSVASPEDPILGSRTKHAGNGPMLEFGRFHIVAASDEMKQVLAFALRVARSEATTVLLEGETGTGKDLMAQFLHYSSSRRTGPFVPVNCSAIPEALLESELFGYDPGAFTDARSPKKGLLELAHGGTLFLDEIGDLSRGMQAKFLRVLEQHAFRRLGGVRDIEVDVRVIAASNRDLSDAVQSGEFRLDLFHRLSVIQIALPALRDRPGAILPLAHHFIREYNAKYQAKVEGISSPAAKLLSGYDWPGNVRELRNVIERAMLIEETRVILPSSIQFVSGRSSRGAARMDQAAPPASPADLSLKHSERNLMVKALEQTGGNKTKAAALLGISRDVLRYRMRKLKLVDGPIAR